MISPKMLFTLLVLIYVTLSHEEDPETDTFSLEGATSDLKKLVNGYLNKISDYGEEAKRKLKEWKIQNAKGGNLEEDIKDLELILNNSVTNYFKEKENTLYKNLLDLKNSKQDHCKQKLEALYEDAKNSLEDAQKYWKDQWDAATNLFKSGVKKSPVTVDQKEVGETDEQPTNKTFLQRFSFLRTIPSNIRKIYREQVDKLKRLATTVKEKIVKKFSRSKHVKTVPAQILNITEEHRPPMNGTKEKDINLHPSVVHKTQEVDRIINNNIETLTDLWTQSKDKEFQPPNFSEFYRDIYDKVNRLVEDIPINK